MALRASIVDETEISGVEIEATLVPTDNLSFYAILGWLDGEYTSITPFQAEGLTGNGSAAVRVAYRAVECALGLELKNAPDFKANFGFTYAMPVELGELSFGVDVAVEDDSWSGWSQIPRRMS